jgi:GNAT superfamily N-acetyltransferase
MLFPDLALARRIEAHEASSSAAHARAQAQLFPATGAEVLPLAGAGAVYCGQRSPLSQVNGLGMSGPVGADDLDLVETFYLGHGLRTRVRLCPLADPSLIRLLAGRGYSVHGFMSVHAQSLCGSRHPEHQEAIFEIRAATPGEAEVWFRRSGADGDWAEPDGIAFMMVRCLHKPGSRLYLAWHDGEPVAGGGLELGDGVAAMIADATLPAFRRQGAQTALLRARLSAAQDAGCDLAMVHTRPGADSQRNVLRAGFQVTYTAAELVGPRGRGAET